MILQSRKNGGFGLAVALLIVAVVTGLLTSLYRSQSGNVLRKEAEIAGWEGAKLARAARIHARNQIVARPNLTTELSIPADGFGGSGPEPVDPDDIINAQLLPDGFARNDGTNFTNALGQTVNIYLANYPVDGDPNDPATVPTAYIIFEDNNQTDARLMQDVVASIRTQDVSVSAPVFNGANNLTGACNGGEDTVALWDTGCLSENDYDLLVDGGNDDDDPFIQGSFIIPTWRSVSFDSRAIARFPQPEQTDSSTMLVNLEMGQMMDCDADDDGVLDQNLITLPNETGSFASDVCSSMDDDDSLLGVNGDLRRSIINTNNISDSFSLIVQPQSGNNVDVSNAGVVAVTGSPVNALNITGSLDGSGDAFIYQGSTNVGGTLSVDKNIQVSSSNISPAFPASANIAVVNANNSSSSNLNVSSRPTFVNDIVISKSLQNVATLTASNEYISSNTSLRLGGSGNNLPANSLFGESIKVTGSATISGNLETPSNIIIQGDQDVAPSLPGYSFAAGSLSTNNLSINNNLNVGQRMNIFGTTNTNRIDVRNNAGNAVCIGDCPRRAITAECNNIRDNLGGFPAFGYGSYSACINQ